MENTMRLSALSSTEFDAIRAWLQENKNLLPEPVCRAMEHYEALVLALQEQGNKTRTLLAELRRALGIVPKSEKRRSEKTSSDKKSRMLTDRDQAKERRGWHSTHMRKNDFMARYLDRKIREEEFVLPQEEIDKLQQERERDEQILESGGEPDPLLLSPREALMEGIRFQIRDEDDGACVSDEITKQAVNILTETRERYDLDLSMVRLNIDVEKAVLSDGSMVSASTWEFGPPRYAVTWNFLINLVLMVCQYAIPVNRLAGMFSSADKQFSSASLSRLFHYVAARLLPIYVALAHELANAEILSGDDTDVRVTEVTKAQKNNERPWESYATPDVAQQNIQGNEGRLAFPLAAELGFESQRKDGKGSKSKFQTSVVWGRSPSNPKTHIVFYRSHIGSFGNLLEALLAKRKTKNKEVVVQSDLATVNLVTDPEIRKHLNIKHVGCASHARRPFALYEEDDPLCTSILLCFRCLYSDEEVLDVHGRNQTNVVGLRQVSSLPIWENILEKCKTLTEKWSSSSKIGEGARYIIRHFDKLTAYTSDARIPLSNDLSERMLRMEKIIQRSSLFRTTLEGRFALDICRTVTQSAICSGVDVREYLRHVLMTKHIDETNAKEFLPGAYRKQFLED